MPLFPQNLEAKNRAAGAMPDRAHEQHAQKGQAMASSKPPKPANGPVPGPSSRPETRHPRPEARPKPVITDYASL